MKNCTKIKVIRNSSNKGVSKAYNQGIKSSLDSKYFLIVNNDVEFRSDSIDNLLAFARKNDYGMVTSIDTLRCYKQDYKSFQIKDEEWEGLCNSCFILKDWVIEKVGYYDEFYFAGWEDCDYIARLNLLGIEKKSTFMSVIKHEEGSTPRNNNWIFGSPEALYSKIHIEGQNYYRRKWNLVHNS